jgi:putative membrane protein
LGDAYLGTQGDVWDAQKDMTLAIVGALITVGLTAAMSKTAGIAAKA